MRYEDIKREFNKKFPNYKILVRPPCISSSRESQYIYNAMAVVLGIQTQSTNIVVDHENKVVLVLR